MDGIGTNVVSYHVKEKLDSKPNIWRSLVRGEIEARNAQQEVIGLTHYSIYSRRRGPGTPDCVLDRIDVYNARQQGKGIGKEMMKRMEEQLDLHGCTNVHFQAVESAVPFYKKIGAGTISSMDSYRGYLLKDSENCIGTHTGDRVRMCKKVNNSSKNDKATRAFLNTYV